MANIDGTSGNDNLDGTSGADVIRGLGGIDTMHGFEGDDVLDSRGGSGAFYGGLGNDIYFADSSGAVELAGEGYDVVYTTSRIFRLDIAGSEWIEGLSTIDWSTTASLTFYGNAIDNYMIGGNGADLLDGLGGNDILVGHGGNDIYFVDSLGDSVVETAGQGYDVIDTYISYALNDTYEVEGLVAAQFNSTNPINLIGNSLANQITGNDGANVLDGRAGADGMNGRGGNDIYLVDNVGDSIGEQAGGGYDVVYTTSTFRLTPGADVEGLSALDWNSTYAMDLTGNDLDNYIIGNDGANVINGRAGHDFLFGRGGADSFVFQQTLGSNYVSWIGDFNAADDTIQLGRISFGLSTGPLNPNIFVVGTQAGDMDDRIIYNQATGNLYYDADGSGAGAQVLFATLAGNPTLTASDFQVI